MRVDPPHPDCTRILASGKGIPLKGYLETLLHEGLEGNQDIR
jgi:hypothetical protein